MGKLKQAGLLSAGLLGGILISLQFSAMAEKEARTSLPIEELRTLITEINRATGQVTRVTGQAQDISQELLTAAERQSHEIEDTNQTVSRCNVGAVVRLTSQPSG